MQQTNVEKCMTEFKSGSKVGNDYQKELNWAYTNMSTLVFSARLWISLLPVTSILPSEFMPSHLVKFSVTCIA